jgi:hypothetical protein
MISLSESVTLAHCSAGSDLLLLAGRRLGGLGGQLSPGRPRAAPCGWWHRQSPAAVCRAQVAQQRAPRTVAHFPSVAEFLEVPVADAVTAVPADAEQDDLGWKPAALEHRHRGEGRSENPPGSRPAWLMQRRRTPQNPVYTRFLALLRPGTSASITIAYGCTR